MISRSDSLATHPGEVLAITLLLACALAAPAAAHDVWLEPSSFRPAPDSPVAIRVLVGEDFRGEAVPRSGERIDRFLARGPGGDVAALGVEGGSPAGYFRPAEAGLFVVGYVTRRAFLELPAGKFERYLRSEGLERVVELRAASGESDEDGREAYSRCAKALVVAVGGEGETAGSGASGRDLADRPFGCTLEILAEAPLDHPAGSETTFRITFRGSPLTGALVQALSAADPGHPLAARSDAEGRVRFTLARPGAWLIKAVYMERAPATLDVDWESWWASLTFLLQDR